MSAHGGKKLLVIGWDAADWQVINPLIRDGKMPALKKLMEGGVSGNIATLSPSLSPILWTSIATGKRAYDHGICGFVENDLEHGVVVPVRATSRKSKAVWSILKEAGLKTNLVNWWPSHPAEKVNGVCVSNHFHKEAPPFGKDWPLSPSAVYPEKWFATLQELRLHPAELTLAHVEPFIPEAGSLDPEKDLVTKSLMRVLAHCSSVHNASTKLMEETEWDFMAVYFEAIDHFSHLAMKYHPPRLPGVDEKEFELYHKIVEGAYQFHDMMLQRQLELAGPDCDVILLSDHGFQSGGLREIDLPDVPAAPALEHRKYGVFAAQGPSFKKGEKVYGASLLDICPSILHLFGLPVGGDMDGHVLHSVFHKKEVESSIPSWELTQERPSFVEEVERVSSPELLAQLQELGYVDLARDDKFQYVETELLYNLCVSLLEGNKLALLEQKAGEGWTSSRELRFGILWIEAYLQGGKNEQACKCLAQVAEDFPENAALQFLEGLLALKENEQLKALEHFLKMEEKGVQSIRLFNEIGRSFFIAGNHKAAVEYFGRSLHLDANNAASLTGKAHCLLEMGYVEEALELLDQSLQQIFYQPNAHYLMAQAALKLRKPNLAFQALKICVGQAPRHLQAARLLQQLSGSGESEEQRPIVIVSGLPRSGTSMLMKMLKAGGMEVLVDEERADDEHNPGGYFEYAPVKALGKESGWMPEARGKVLKVVSPLLRYLPASENYKLLLIKRPLTEVVVSQEVMKGRTREEVMKNFPFQMAVNLQNEEQRLQNWLEMQPNIRWLEIEYYHCLERPAEVLTALSDFIGIPLNTEKAASVINHQLHRNKLAKP